VFQPAFCNTSHSLKKNREISKSDNNRLETGKALNQVFSILIEYTNTGEGESVVLSLSSPKESLSHSSVVHRLVMSFLPSDLALAHEGVISQFLTKPRNYSLSLTISSCTNKQ
jgi:hypothetical protein